MDGLERKKLQIFQMIAQEVVNEDLWREYMCHGVSPIPETTGIISNGALGILFRILYENAHFLNICWIFFSILMHKHAVLLHGLHTIYSLILDLRGFRVSLEFKFLLDMSYIVRGIVILYPVTHVLT